MLNREFCKKTKTGKDYFFGGNSHMKNKPTVRICEDYVVRNQEEVQKILKRISQIISKSYIRRMNETMN